jgi:hypothetical protein
VGQSGGQDRLWPVLPDRRAAVERSGVGELVEGLVSPPGRSADLLGGNTGYPQRVPHVINRGDTGGGEQFAEPHGFRGADLQAGSGGLAGEILDAGLADDLAVAQNDQPGGGLRISLIRCGDTRTVRPSAVSDLSSSRI